VHASARQAEIQQSLVASPLSGVDAFLKRAIDIVGAAVLFLLAFPFIAILAVVIKAQDGGPMVYRRRVVGPRGQFDAFKLRTMRADADTVLRQDAALRRQFEINFKLEKDPRVTTFGSFLRRTSLDELPQLWNVLRGQMSLVGPRMITAGELPKYGDSAWIFQTVKPGLTGYWQVEGRQQVSYKQRVEMDLFYINHWSLLLDLKIMMKTPFGVIRGTGAH
jgi:lipopolysaccharide/colanic/teichoic acid biosynthesis glycosyltransferase